jgi:nucleotide-binding universal stress UspA family protein
MVQANGFDLVIKEADNIDWLDHLFGSDDMHLLRKCPCPVWIMKKDDKPEYRNIMAAVDFGDEVEPCTNELNLRILERASSLSMAELTTLHVVNAYDVPLAGFVSQWVEQPEKVKKNLYEAEHVKRQIQLDALMADLKQKIGTESYNYVAPRPLLVQGPPGRELPKLADNLKIDLVVMGTVARSGIAGVIIGNTAETVLSQLQCSVLAIKPKGFISPIS